MVLGNAVLLATTTGRVNGSRLASQTSRWPWLSAPIRRDLGSPYRSCRVTQGVHDVGYQRGSDPGSVQPDGGVELDQLDRGRSHVGHAAVDG